jgi:hypothetical protein
VKTKLEKFRNDGRLLVNETMNLSMFDGPAVASINKAFDSFQQEFLKEHVSTNISPILDPGVKKTLDLASVPKK